MSFTPEGTLTRTTYGPDSEGWPTTTARRADGGKDGNGSQSMSSGRVDLNSAWSGWWVVAMVVRASDAITTTTTSVLPQAYSAPPGATPQPPSRPMPAARSSR